YRVIFLLQLLEAGILAQFSEAQKLIRRLFYILVFQIFVGVTVVKSVSGQFYIELVPGYTQVFKMAARDIEAVLTGRIVIGGRVNGQASYDLVSLHDVRDIQALNHSVSEGRVVTVAFIKASAHLHLSCGEGNHAIRAEVFNALESAPPVRTKDR